MSKRHGFPSFVSIVDGQILHLTTVNTQQIVSYLAENSKNNVAQVLALVKSYWPSAKIALLGDGIAVTCDDDKFEYVKEVEPVAERIVKMFEQ